MKKLLVAASALGLIASTPAMAAEGEIALNATVTPQCGVGNHLSGSASAPGWDQSDITVALADSNGQFNAANATYTNRSFGNVWCNAPANVTLEVGALRRRGSGCLVKACRRIQRHSGVDALARRLARSEERLPRRAKPP